MTRPRITLTELARLGFVELESSRNLLESFSPDLVRFFASAADADQALRLLDRVRDRAPRELDALLADERSAHRLIRLFGASEGLGEFFLRRPAELAAVEEVAQPWTQAAYTADLLTGIRSLTGDDARVALRVRYRRHLARITAWDLEHPDPLEAVSTVTAALSDLAGAALDAALNCARREMPYPPDEVAATRLAIIGMGKAGARELNYVSDVDVIFVGEGDGTIAPERALEIATRLAMVTMRGLTELAAEPLLWEVDANLRPEGKDGALVRTLQSHGAYYDRWAKSWEFQALLKARPLAGDPDLGARYVALVEPLVFSSASREGFVESVQAMRERVTAHIPADEVDLQVKLGPGGLRDIEFTIQLLQLVHGQFDESVRARDTLTALSTLASGGYIGRDESAEFARDYRLLRLFEHRLQLSRLRRTHLMPRDEADRRVLARASGLFGTARELTDAWQRTKLAVRSLHERLFYRPLLSAVAALPAEEVALSSEQATARLAAIGFRDPAGALRHIGALTTGVSRRATIQRTLLPVMLQWFADGADPDQGLLAFRRLSDDLGEAHWFLRTLRDSSGAAHRLTNVLSSSHFAVALFERIPDAVAWLEHDEDLQPRPLGTLLEEVRATVARHPTVDAAAGALRTLRRREVLRLALGSMLDAVPIEALGVGLSDIATATLTGILTLVREPDDGIEFGIIGMGRYGGQELGFGSDLDVMYVYRARSVEPEKAQVAAERIVKGLRALTEDLRLPFDLDPGLRPEGKTGAIVRSLDSYRAYYERWSLTWEAQALLRARGTVGDEALLSDFEALADEVRHPSAIGEHAVREIKRIKARVEAERLPQGADPSRHLKLGRGSLSDVEWFVQLLQLQHAASTPALKTTSTLGALAAAEDAGLVSTADAGRLRAAWLMASRARSAMTLWNAKTSDVLPTERRQLEGVARIMGYPPGSASQLEHDYLGVTRRARQVFDRLFYGTAESAHDH
ncbi:bifunctional [glutamine synthetase] adenylyltransferase/[glutamine synthetase]-adenylyl-L-tyrosine phosphorylase [Diaminobutyricimonas sp. LJ205]|uniref:bifunctional [glutamine synthetase] adenylyltransferase/[glutamine synthetase]-adenylyl-L-tyrosine phosphorylase n=1 Tax=Diaminobutyricimonas sp. LJ205 TaxID=2683590 RepID=UPI0012F4A404|nr:bifunctional [glutamine synthetase] adenylyltransferase/[glutamine synthetase]-adenylyl-L-tyrosine phosphorylase [Diaminobutyricimonas sp. LJ205]